MEGSARLALIPIVVCERIQHLRGSNLLLPPRPSKPVLRLPRSQQTLHNLCVLASSSGAQWQAKHNSQCQATPKGKVEAHCKAKPEPKPHAKQGPKAQFEPKPQAKQGPKAKPGLRPTLLKTFALLASTRKSIKVKAGVLVTYQHARNPK